MRGRGWRLLAAGFGSGWSPFAPGTSGTFAAVPFAWVWSCLPPTVHGALLMLCLPLGAAVCGRAARDDGREDPPWVVFDEMVGYWFAVAFLRPGWVGLGVGFFLFRLFDILKPAPAGWIDRELRGGWGILLDDVVAGVYARVALALLGALGVL